MNKKLLILGIAVLLLAVGLSGCNEQESTKNPNDNRYNPGYFDLYMEVDNYHSDILLTFFFQMGDVNNIVKETLIIPKDEHRAFDVSLETGHDQYFIMVCYSYDYNNPEQIDEVAINEYNPTNRDIYCKTTIDKYGEIEID